MGVSKRLNRLALLGLLACGGAWAQQDVAVQVSMSATATFLVDGQPFSTPQIFHWAVGSVHQVYFVQSTELDGSVGNHQYSASPGVRYTFGAWNVTGQVPLNPSAPLLIISVAPTLTHIVGQVTLEVLLSINFNGFTDPTLECSSNPLQNDPRQGVVTVNGACFSSPTSIWIPAGPTNFAAGPFPGFIFSNWLINGSPVSGQTLSGYPIMLPSTVSAMFIKAKRVRIRSNPLGFGLLVDRQPIQPGPIDTTSYTGDPYCPVAYGQLSVGFPVLYVPLCVGDFDFVPGSQHIIAAPPVQGDGLGRTWLFTGFSNGLGQNAVYTADLNTSVTDSFTANFILIVPTQVVTSPAGLTVNVDGQDDSKGTQRVWAEGQIHHLIAPQTQTDSTGRPWKFVSWSNGGTAEQNYTVPAGQPGGYLTATYEPVGKLQVVSVPSGLPFVVDGVACNTPCVILDKATGTQVQVAAPASTSPDAFRRYNFVSWNGGNTSTTTQVTIGDQVQVLVATYQGSFKLTATSNPPNHVSFFFNPVSSDGFYTEGASVAVTANPFNGATFKHWAGDLTGTSQTMSLVMNAPHFVVAVLEGFPFISENGIRSATGPTPAGTVGPGSDISIYGEDLAATAKSAPAGQLTQAIDDVWVTVNDRLMPLLYVSPQLINAQLFSDLPDGTYTLTVHRTAQKDASQTFKIRRDSPGLFQWYSPQGSTVAAFHEDGTILTAASPAILNETITILGTGFGLYDRPLVDGFLTPDTGIWNVADTVKVTADGQTYTPVSARAGNGSVGIVAVRVKLTGALPSGPVDLKVNVGGVDSATVTLPVK